MSEPLGKVSAMGDERRRILLTGEPRGHKEDKAMDREKMLDVTLQQIEKQFGKGAIMKLGEHPMGAGITVIPSGSLALDIALGGGGFPRGRIIEIFGPKARARPRSSAHDRGSTGARAASRRSSTRSTRSTPPTPASSA